MKPKIDLDNSIVKLALKIQQNEVEKALDIEQTVEKAVIPIYSIPKSKAHNNRKTKPEQIGSGVLIKIKTEFFIFSATHVFCEFEDKAVLVGTLENGPIEQIAGDRLSSGSFKDKIDKFDATVFHVQSEISETLKKIAITLEDCDFDTEDDSFPIFMITGFLAKESNTSGNMISSKARNFPTVEIQQYSEYGYDKVPHILLAYENQTLVENRWRLTPIPRGMSGGAIIKAQGTKLNFKNKTQKEKKQLLTAITIEHYKDKGGKIGFVLGTRLNVFLGLIYQDMPELLEDFLKNYETTANS